MAGHPWMLRGCSNERSKRVSRYDEDPRRQDLSFKDVIAILLQWNRDGVVLQPSFQIGFLDPYIPSDSHVRDLLRLDHVIDLRLGQLQVEGYFALSKLCCMASTNFSNLRS